MSSNYQITINNKRISDFYNTHTCLDFEQINLLCIDLFENILQDAATTMNKSISSQILSECLENKTKLTEMQSAIAANMQSINTSFSKLTTDIYIKLLDIKKEYIDEIKTVITINLNDKIRDMLEKTHNALSSDISNKFDKPLNETVDKIASLVDKNTSQVIDKTHIMLNQIIPDNNTRLSKQIQDDINKFYSMVNEDLKHFLLINGTTDAVIIDFIKTQTEKNIQDKDKFDKLLTDMTAVKLDNFINNFDSKYNTLMQSIQQPILQVLSMNDERINKNINKHQETQEKMLSNLDEFLNKYKNNSSLKGKFSENLLQKVIVQMFPTAEIIDTSKLNHTGDIIVKRENKNDILFENKDYADNVSTDEVTKFIGDCEKQKMHGIILSQNTGITSKKNYHIDIKKGKVLVYVHNVDYSQYKIQIAVDIIDTLSDKLKDVTADNDSEDNEDTTISKEVLEEINLEFNKFIIQKETVISLVKDCQKKIIDEIKNISFPSLDKYLASKFNSSDKITFTCDVCNLFNATSKKALSSHKRSKECKNRETTIQITINDPNK